MGELNPRSTVAAGTVLELLLTYQFQTNCLSATADRTTVRIGPLLPEAHGALPT